MWKRLLLVAIVLIFCFVWWSNRSVSRAAGVIAPGIPQQHTLAGVNPMNIDGYEVTPIAQFDLEARVLGVKHYRLDREAKLAPFDLALGWGRMSDSKILNEFKISQSGRFYHWSTRSCPIPRNEVIRSSANMHIIPADAAVMSRLQRIREGHIVKLSGYLVMAKADDGFIWVSSTTREDSGDGACEIVWVKEIDYH